MATTTAASTARVRRVGFAGALAVLVGLAITIAVGATMLANPMIRSVDPNSPGWMTVENTYNGLREHQAREYGPLSRSLPADVWLKLRQHQIREYGAASAALTATEIAAELRKQSIRENRASAALTATEIAAELRKQSIRENGTASSPSSAIDVPAALREHQEREYGAP